MELGGLSPPRGPRGSRAPLGPWAQQSTPTVQGRSPSVPPLGPGGYFFSVALRLSQICLFRHVLIGLYHGLHRVYYRHQILRDEVEPMSSWLFQIAGFKEALLPIERFLTSLTGSMVGQTLTQH